MICIHVPKTNFVLRRGRVPINTKHYAKAGGHGTETDQKFLSLGFKRPRSLVFD